VKPDGSFVLIGLHVDDSLIVYNSDEELQDIVDASTHTQIQEKQDSTLLTEPVKQKLLLFLHIARIFA
jgi:hypothetical protein